jgi:CelD/BcsL family acetyltransferase involved in cellulose biosynthesis
MITTMPVAGQKLAVRVEIVRDLGSLHELEDDWRDLAVARGNAFVTPEWFFAWWGFYGDAHEPLVAIGRDADGRLLGVLPLVVRMRPPRTARFAGSALGDFFQPAAAAEDEDEVTAAIAAMLSVASPCAALVLENVESGAIWWRAFAAESRGGYEPVFDRESVLPSIRLSDRTWEQYLASRSRNLRSQIGRKRRALERDHDVDVRWTEDPDGLEEDIQTLFRLHDARWATMDRGSSLTSERARAFHGAFASKALERGWLRLGFLDVDGEPVAAWYGWRVGDRFAYHQAGFDPAWADESVGFILFAATIRRAIEEGVCEYDMLLGDAAFKQRFADLQRFVCSAVFAPRLSPTRVLASVEARLRGAARSLPDSVREPIRHGTAELRHKLPLARHR